MENPTDIINFVNVQIHQTLKASQYLSGFTKSKKQFIPTFLSPDLAPFYYSSQPSCFDGSLTLEHYFPELMLLQCHMMVSWAGTPALLCCHYCSIWHLLLSWCLESALVALVSDMTLIEFAWVGLV